MKYRIKHIAMILQRLADAKVEHERRQQNYCQGYQVYEGPHHSYHNWAFRRWQSYFSSDLISRLEFSTLNPCCRAEEE